jgi:hypothetical protein
MRKFILGLAGGSLAALIGCATINVPDKIDVGGYSRSPRVDSRRVPKTTTINECHDELYRAYAYIQSLERRNQKLEDDKDRLKSENSALKKRLKRYQEK